MKNDIKPITVSELISHLEELDPNMQVVVHRPGNDHYHPVTINRMSVVKPDVVYFPDGNLPDVTSDKVLIIGHVGY
jgi:hypothetical protein